MSRLNIAAIQQKLKTFLQSAGPSVALHEPVFGGREWEYLKDCLDSGYVSSVGSYVDRFESQLAEYCGARHAVATVNGTSALHLCLKVAGVQAGDEVLVPAFTFVAPANAVSYCGAFPHFVDSENRSLGVDAAKLGDYLAGAAELRDDACFNRKTGRRIAALIVVHVFGHPADMDALLELAQRYRLTVIEDAAEAIGSRYKNRFAGTLGHLGALSFNGNKTITTGGGGAVLCENPERAALARHLSTTARTPHPRAIRHDRVGYNYRMPNINAALGCAQLEQLPQLLERKRRLAEQYQKIFQDVEDVRFFSEPDYAESNYWLNAVVLENAANGERDALLEALNGDGIMARPAWTLMHRLSMYERCPAMDLTVAETVAAGLVNLPSSAFLGNAT